MRRLPAVAQKRAFRTLDADRTTRAAWPASGATATAGCSTTECSAWSRRASAPAAEDAGCRARFACVASAQASRDSQTPLMAAAERRLSQRRSSMAAATVSTTGSCRACGSLQRDCWRWRWTTLTLTLASASASARSKKARNPRRGLQSRRALWQRAWRH